VTYWVQVLENTVSNFFSQLVDPRLMGVTFLIFIAIYMVMRRIPLNSAAVFLIPAIIYVSATFIPWAGILTAFILGGVATYLYLRWVG